MAAIMLVDDDEDFRYIFRALLVRHGHIVYEAPNGAGCVRTARELAPDVIVLDLAMPVVNGLEAVQALKADPKTAGIPVIALTAHASLLDDDPPLRRHFHACFAKPVELNAFMETLAGCVRGDGLVRSGGPP